MWNGLAGVLMGLLVLGGAGVALGVGEKRFWRGWLADERILIKVGAWVLMVYGAVAGSFLAGAEAYQAWLMAGSLLVGGVAVWRGRREVRRARGILLGAAAVFVLALAMTGLVRQLGGGMWYGDWAEHLERSWFWRGEMRDDEFVMVYKLPSRPPGQNVVAAGVLAVAEAVTGVDGRRGQADGRGGIGLASLQLTNVLCAGLAMLPVMVFARWWAGGRGTWSRRGVSWGLVALVVTSGPFIAHLLFPWTRMLHAFFTVGGLYFYLRSQQKSDWRRLVVAVGALSAAMLVHYSAGPVVVAVGGHMLAVGLRRCSHITRTVAASTLLASVIFGSWLAFSIGRYGIDTTFKSNTTVTDASQLKQGTQLSKTLYHIYYSLTPHMLDTPLSRFDEVFAQKSGIGKWRDFTFISYAHTMLAGMGPGVAGLGLGGLVTIALAVRDGWRSRVGNKGLGRWGWSWLIVSWFVVGCAVVGELSQLGVAHISMFPLQLMSLAYLSARWTNLPRWLRVSLVAAVALDALLVVLPQLVCLSVEVSTGANWPYSLWAHDNLRLAQHMGVRTLGMWLGGGRVVLALAGAVFFAWVLRRTWREVSPKVRP